MKNASQIINILQDKPQFSKLTESTCIKTLKSALLPSIQKNIKNSYIHNNILFFVLTTRLNKLDADNIINNIKMILNSPMILNSQKFIECLETKIEDVKVYSDFKPLKKNNLYTTNTHTLTYKERASGEINIDIKDEKLSAITQEIFQIIKDKK